MTRTPGRASFVRALGESSEASLTTTTSLASAGVEVSGPSSSQYVRQTLQPEVRKASSVVGDLDPASSTTPCRPLRSTPTTSCAALDSDRVPATTPGSICTATGPTGELS